MHLKNYALRKVKSINNLGWSTSVSWRKNEYLRLCGQANALLSCYHLSMEIAHRVRDVSCACFRHLSVSDDCTPVSLPAPFQFWMLHQHWFSWHLLAAEPISGPSSDWTMNPNSIELLPLSPSHTISFHHWYNRTHAFICCLPVPTIYESNPQMMGLRQIGSNLFQSQCPTSLHSFFTNLNYKNRWAPSSSNLLHMTHLASSSIPLLFRFIRTARLLCTKRQRKCLIFPGHFRDQIPFQA